MTRSSWFQVVAARGATRMRLVAFPHAGGHAGFFRQWATRLPGDVELVGVELPARRGRFAEPPLTSVAAIVDGLVPALAPLLDRPFLLFGHSMGALVAFEVARRLRDHGLAMPSSLVVSGRRAPHLPARRRDLHRLPDRDLIAELAAMGGTSIDILREPELMTLLLPSLRADLTAVETYRFRPAAPLDLPIVAVGGTVDDQALLSELEGWAEHTTWPLEVRQLVGGHFYLLTDPAPLLDLLAPVLAPSPRSRSMTG